MFSTIICKQIPHFRFAFCEGLDVLTLETAYLLVEIWFSRSRILTRSSLAFLSRLFSSSPTCASLNAAPFSHGVGRHDSKVSRCRAQGVFLLLFVVCWQVVAKAAVLYCPSMCGRFSLIVKTSLSQTQRCNSPLISTHYVTSLCFGQVPLPSTDVYSSYRFVHAYRSFLPFFEMVMPYGFLCSLPDRAIY